jgi:hypothetical protein
VVTRAGTHTALGHRKVWATTRHDGHQLSPSTALRILRRRGLGQPAGYTRERRQLAAARRAAFTAPPSAPNQLCQLDLGEFETNPRAAVAGTVTLLVNPVSDQIRALQRDLPALIDNANASLASLQQWLDGRGLGIQIAGRGETALETVRSNLL